MFICVGLAGARCDTVWHLAGELKELQFYIQGLALSARLYPEPTRSSFQRFVHILMTREIKYFAHREELAWTKKSKNVDFPYFHWLETRVQRFHWLKMSFMSVC